MRKLPFKCVFCIILCGSESQVKMFVQLKVYKNAFSKVIFVFLHLKKALLSHFGILDATNGRALITHIRISGYWGGGEIPSSVYTTLNDTNIGHRKRAVITQHVSNNDDGLTSINSRIMFYAKRITQSREKF